MHNDFKMDTNPTVKKEFIKKIEVIYILAIFLTGVVSLAGVLYIFGGIINSVWVEIGIANYLYNIINYGLYFILFITLITTMINKQPFSRMMVFCFKLIGTIYIICSFVYPRLPGYKSSGFELFSSGSFVLMDGNIVLKGLLFIILASILLAGFNMQKDSDETI